MIERVEMIETLAEPERTQVSTYNKQGDYGPLILFQGQSITFVSFGLLTGIGALLGLTHTWFYLSAYHIIPNAHQANQLALALAFGTPLSAYILTRLLDIKTWLSGEKTFVQYIRTVSFGLWGGLVGGLLIMSSFAFMTSTPLLAILDAFAVGVPLSQVMGRLACLNYGCCHGKVCDSRTRFSIRYYNPLAKVLRYDPSLKGKRLHPTQIYSALANLSIYAIILFLAFSWDTRSVGILAAVYMILYGTKRFIVEFLRGEFPRIYFSGLSVWQWFSLTFVTLGFGIMIYALTQTPQVGPVNFESGFQGMISAMGVLAFTSATMGLAYGTHGKKVGSW